MTTVNKPLKRVVENINRGRDAVVTLYPGGAIGLRLKRHKKEFFISMKSVFQMAVIRTVATEKAEKRAAKGLKPIKRLVRRGAIS